MRCSLSIQIAAIGMILASVALASVAIAQTSATYTNVGKAPTQEEIKAWDIGISYDGGGLPPGSGSAKEGAVVYANNCSYCHGLDLKGVGAGTPNPIAPALVGGEGSLTTTRPIRTIGSFYPFATTVWDFVNRAMPRGRTRTLTPTEVYAVTAFLLYKNNIIKETDVMDAESLPKVQMPNRNGFLPARIEDIPDRKKRGCTRGQCPETTIPQ
jgi:S-disulfanyl-L-cysteine oxidoreductase SoxD